WRCQYLPPDAPFGLLALTCIKAASLAAESPRCARPYRHTEIASRGAGAPWPGARSAGVRLEGAPCRSPRRKWRLPARRLLEESLDRTALTRLARHLHALGERAAHRAGGVDDHLGAHDIVGLRRIERVALDVLDDVDVLVGLHAGGEGPHHLLLVERIDVGVDHDHVLHEVAFAERDQRRLLAL